MTNPSPQAAADISLTDFPASSAVLKVSGPGSSAPIYLVPHAEDVAALRAHGVPRAQVFTLLELLEIFLTRPQGRGATDGRG
jgi:hypothetical protein